MAAALLAVLVALASAPAAHAQTTMPGWQWSVEGTVFAGYNYQYRKFSDFDEFESQNWLMTAAARDLGAGRLRLSAMFSFEPFTLRDIGSPQVFQTGETFVGAPLIDYQHPHDLIMNLGGAFTPRSSGTKFTIGAYLVGQAPLGPPIFMHRPSAAENPQAPLGHHLLDSTHITPGVITGAIARGPWSFEAGVFQGREPDENRLDLDLGALDSFAARLSWARGAWSAQVSAGALTQPERLSPYDSDRLTASVSYLKGDSRRSLAWIAAFGQNREVHGNFEAYLLEGLGTFSRNRVYVRAEYVAKDILDAGFHPGGFHVHRQSPIGALTIGYSRDLFRQRTASNPDGRSLGGLALGADITGYLVPDNLAEPYGSPLSFHVFLRYRGRAGSPELHVH